MLESRMHHPDSHSSENAHHGAQQQVAHVHGRWQKMITKFQPPKKILSMHEPLYKKPNSYAHTHTMDPNAPSYRQVHFRNHDQGDERFLQHRQSKHIVHPMQLREGGFYASSVLMSACPAVFHAEWTASKTKVTSVAGKNCCMQNCESAPRARATGGPPRACPLGRSGPARLGPRSDTERHALQLSSTRLGHIRRPRFPSGGMKRRLPAFAMTFPSKSADPLHHGAHLKFRRCADH
jgi:hypothetical protein